LDEGLVCHIVGQRPWASLTSNHKEQRATLLILHVVVYVHASLYICVYAWHMFTCVLRHKRGKIVRNPEVLRILSRNGWG
jgi:hypothetical protein